MAPVLMVSVLLESPIVILRVFLALNMMKYQMFQNFAKVFVKYQEEDLPRTYPDICKSRYVDMNRKISEPLVLNVLRSIFVLPVQNSSWLMLLKILFH